MRALKLRSTRKYYKYYNSEDIGSGKQACELVRTPVFSSASTTDGVSFIDGGDMFYEATQSEFRLIARGQTVSFDLGEHCIGISAFGFTGTVWVNHYPSMSMWDVQCSEDGETWVQLDNYGSRDITYKTAYCIGYSNNYRYLKFTTGVDDVTSAYYTVGYAKEFTIWYLRQYAYETNSANYDFYEDTYSYLGLSNAENNIYKLFRTYEKGQVCKEMFNS